MLNIGRQPISLQKWFRPIAQQPMGTYDKLPNGWELCEIDGVFWHVFYVLSTYCFTCEKSNIFYLYSVYMFHTQVYVCQLLKISANMTLHVSYTLVCYPILSYLSRPTRLLSIFSM